jgi:hypothetical protein
MAMASCVWTQMASSVRNLVRQVMPVAFRVGQGVGTKPLRQCDRLRPCPLLMKQVGDEGAVEAADG